MSAQKQGVSNMKHTKIFLTFAVLLCAAAFFAGCPTDPADEEPNYGGDVDAFAFELTAAGEIKYYSLSTREEVADPAGNAWDIAFENSRLVYTNSGATAVTLSSGGQGGVWHTDKLDLEGVTQNDAIKDDPLYGPYNEDVIRYVGPMTGSATPRRINVMTFVGYNNEETNDGSEDKPFSSSYLYDKKQFYDMVSMQPLQIDDTNQVYIVRHGDGQHYSKIQIHYERQAPKDIYQIRVSNF
jgi:hypothetical protein